MSDKKIEFRTCPFCDGDEIMIERVAPEYVTSGYYYCRCQDCGSQGETCKTREQAIKAWNTRAVDVGWVKEGLI